MGIQETDLARTRKACARLVVVERTGSTNRDLVDAASADPSGWPHLSVLLTDEQTAGRGRQGRTWQAAPGTSLAVSVLLRPDQLPGDLPIGAFGWLPLLAGVAMKRAVAAQGATAAELKWPNDVLIAGRKVCGILAELLPDAAGVVVGSGINLTMTEAQLPVPTATSLALAGVAAPDADALLADYLTGLSTLVSELANAGGDADAAGIRPLVERECATVGRDVRIELPDGAVRETRATGLDGDGRLVVITDDGTASVAAGDVTHLRY
ncbi:MAG: biotin--[acetyl-CoA-carboxylase] ligase [Microbacteriaceae bacterium]|nr:biotin--[acetyl-CoA-carboxylase] ligase [Microbacteriaceae bacterium]MCL2794533.1 biotin--[acetyl-CoA-carboxylase] ligase [Microbacteriaceae bacterium]